MSGADLLQHINASFQPKWTYILDKADVKGETATPLYKFLKAHKNCSGTFGNEIKWSFTKFLCDKQGVPRYRWGPSSKPLALSEKIEKLLKE